MERIDKVVALAAGISRADARKAVLRSRVEVNGRAVRDIALKVDPEKDKITFEGKAITYKKFIYLMMNKPEGVLSATTDKNKQTVIDLIPDSLKRKDLFPVGRLDKNTTGLLLITDDGELAHRLLSPKYNISKTYLAKLDGQVTDRVVEGFKKGLTLLDGTSLSPAILEVLEDKKTARITVTEGKYHQIKRMFGLYELPVEALKRISFAGLPLPPELAAGEVRELTERELELLKRQIFL